MCFFFLNLFGEKDVLTYTDIPTFLRFSGGVGGVEVKFAWMLGFVVIRGKNLWSGHV